LPAFDQRADIAFEHLSQIVVTIELVLIGDASEALNGLGDGHGQLLAVG
jgi:hypothetical protein